MRSDKALLPFRGRTLIEHIAAQVLRSAGHVSLVGDARRYSNFGYSVIEDIFPGRGPLSGIHAALTASLADWNLIVACDMPSLSPPFLNRIFERAETGTADAVVPAGPSGKPEPLCAVYRRQSVQVIDQALAVGVRKVMEGLDGLRIDLWSVADPRYFHNLNTPEQWACYPHD
jgi:molybdopterin-guanine dinucleotide biosynthesis protein A